MNVEISVPVLREKIIKTSAVLQLLADRDDEVRRLKIKLDVISNKFQARNDQIVELKNDLTKSRVSTEKKQILLEKLQNELNALKAEHSSLQDIYNQTSYKYQLACMELEDHKSVVNFIRAPSPQKDNKTVKKAPKGLADNEILKKIEKLQQELVKKEKEVDRLKEKHKKDLETLKDKSSQQSLNYQNKISKLQNQLKEKNKNEETDVSKDKEWNHHLIESLNKQINQLEDKTEQLELENNLLKVSLKSKIKTTVFNGKIVSNNKSKKDISDKNNELNENTDSLMSLETVYSERLNDFNNVPKIFEDENSNLGFCGFTEDNNSLNGALLPTLEDKNCSNESSKAGKRDKPSKIEKSSQISKIEKIDGNKRNDDYLSKIFKEMVHFPSVLSPLSCDAVSEVDNEEIITSNSNEAKTKQQADKNKTEPNNQLSNNILTYSDNSNSNWIINDIAENEIKEISNKQFKNLASFKANLKIIKKSRKNKLRTKNKIKKNYKMVLVKKLKKFEKKLLKENEKILRKNYLENNKYLLKKKKKMEQNLMNLISKKVTTNVLKAIKSNTSNKKLKKIDLYDTNESGYSELDEKQNLCILKQNKRLIMDKLRKRRLSLLVENDKKPKRKRKTSLNTENYQYSNFFTESKNTSSVSSGDFSSAFSHFPSNLEEDQNLICRSVDSGYVITDSESLDTCLSLKNPSNNEFECSKGNCNEITSKSDGKITQFGFKIAKFNRKRSRSSCSHSDLRKNRRRSILSDSECYRSKNDAKTNFSNVEDGFLDNEKFKNALLDKISEENEQESFLVQNNSNISDNHDVFGLINTKEFNKKTTKEISNNTTKDFGNNISKEISNKAIKDFGEICSENSQENAEIDKENFDDLNCDNLTQNFSMFCKNNGNEKTRKSTIKSKQNAVKNSEIIQENIKENVEQFVHNEHTKKKHKSSKNKEVSQENITESVQNKNKHKTAENITENVTDLVQNENSKKKHKTSKNIEVIQENLTENIAQQIDDKNTKILDELVELFTTKTCRNDIATTNKVETRNIFSSKAFEDFESNFTKKSMDNFHQKQYYEDISSFDESNASIGFLNATRELFGDLTTTDSDRDSKKIKKKRKTQVLDDKIENKQENIEQISENKQIVNSASSDSDKGSQKSIKKKRKSQSNEKIDKSIIENDNELIENDLNLSSLSSESDKESTKTIKKKRKLQNKHEETENLANIEENIAENVTKEDIFGGFSSSSDLESCISSKINRKNQFKDLKIDKLKRVEQYVNENLTNEQLFGSITSDSERECLLSFKTGLNAKKNDTEDGENVSEAYKKATELLFGDKSMNSDKEEIKNTKTAKEIFKIANSNKDKSKSTNSDQETLKRKTKKAQNKTEIALQTSKNDHSDLETNKKVKATQIIFKQTNLDKTNANTSMEYLFGSDLSSDSDEGIIRRRTRSLTKLKLLRTKQEKVKKLKNKIDIELNSSGPEIDISSKNSDKTNKEQVSIDKKAEKELDKSYKEILERLELDKIKEINKNVKIGGFKKPNCRKMSMESPLSPPHEITEDIPEFLLKTPKIIPTEKAKKLTENEANKLFERLLGFNKEETVLKEVASKFLNQTANHIALLITKCALQHLHENIDMKYTPPAPPMSETQRTLMGFMVYLESTGLENVLNCFLSQAEMHILSIDKVILVNSLVRLYTAVCLYKKDVYRIRKFCCDILYCSKDLILPIFNAMLSSWPEIVPKQGDKAFESALVKVFVQVLYFMESDHKKSVLTVRTLLKEFHKCPVEDFNLVELFGKLVEEYSDVPTDELYYSLLLLCKTQPTKWVSQQIKAKIDPILKETKDEEVQEYLMELKEELEERCNN